MKSGEKKFILILLAITIVVGVIAFFVSRNGNETTNGGQQTSQDNNGEYVQNLDDGTKLNVSEQLQKTKTLDGLEFTNIQLTEKGGITTLLADVENKSGKAISEKKLKIDILDKEGKTITTANGTILKLENGAKTQLNASVSVDASNAYDFKISNR